MPVSKKRRRESNVYEYKQIVQYDENKTLYKVEWSNNQFTWEPSFNIGAQGINRFWETQNESKVFYCSCVKTYEEDSNVMFECDHCKEWYHYHCQAIAYSEEHENQVVLCNKCSSDRHEGLETLNLSNDTFIKESKDVDEKCLLISYIMATQTDMTVKTLEDGMTQAGRQFMDDMIKRGLEYSFSKSQARLSASEGFKMTDLIRGLKWLNASWRAKRIYPTPRWGMSFLNIGKRNLLNRAFLIIGKPPTGVNKKFIETKWKPNKKKRKGKASTRASRLQRIIHSNPTKGFLHAIAIRIDKNGRCNLFDGGLSKIHSFDLNAQQSELGLKISKSIMPITSVYDVTPVLRQV